MIYPLYPCLWYDGQAKAAAELYCSVFKNSKVTADNGMVVNFELNGQKFMGLNGGPQFKINPSISIFAVLETEEETEAAWQKLLEGGSVLMALDTYPWSKKYGWLQDRFGLSWQISLGDMKDVEGQQFTPSLLFVGEQFGKAEEAIKFYTSIFKPSHITGIRHNTAHDEDREGTVKHAQFSINKYLLMAMDSSLNHAFSFNEAISFVIECDTQEEIDLYWNTFAEGGKESMCGWISDRFGVWWQVLPKALGKLMSDPEKAPRVVQAFLKMKKFDIAALEQA